MASSPETGWADISDAVFFHAERRPEAVAVIEGGDRVSYGELAQLIAAAASDLRELGIARREVVAVVMPGTIDHVVLTLALIRIGAVPLDLPVPQPGQNPLQGMEHFAIGRVFASEGIAHPDGAIVHSVPATWRDELKSRTGADIHENGNPDEDFYLNFTSGSTGAPKGIVTTRRQWQARYVTAQKLFPFLLSPERPPHLLVIGGMAFSAFFFFLANQLFIGGPIVLMTGAHDPGQLAATINAWDDAAMLITPPLAREFIARAPKTGILFPKVRALFIGAAPFFAEEKVAARARLSPRTYEVYGSAACGFLAALPPDEFDSKAHTVGSPVEDVGVEVVDQDGNRVPSGHTGHIRCRGPGISQGFYGETAGNGNGAEGFRDGWYYPGDLGTRDADGYLSLKGRVTEIIRRRGVEIFPTDLEQVLLSYPTIKEAAVVGAAPVSGGKDRRIVAFAAARGAVQPHDLAQHCLNSLPPDRLPDQLILLAELPKTGTGKIDRPRLTMMADRPLPGTEPAAAPETVLADAV